LASLGLAIALTFIGGAPSSAQDTTAALIGNHPANAETEEPIGAREPDGQLSMAVTLRLRDRVGAERLLEQIEDPASPNYHHWLSSADFAARFDPAQAVVDTIANWLASRGLTILSSSRTQRAIRFTGTVAQAQQAFHTTIFNFGSGNTYGNVNDPLIPARFATLVANIHGLDNMRAAKASSHFIPGFAKNPTGPQPGRTVRSAQIYASLSRSGSASDASPANASPNATIGGETAFGPADFLTFYDETPLANGGISGAGGDCIAIVSDSDLEQSSINAFNSAFNEPPSNITTVFADGSDPGFNGDEQEALLDLEWSHAVAPGATIRFYEGNVAAPAIDPIVDAISAAVNDNQCGVISVSFIECGGSRSFYTDTVSPIYLQAAAQGQSIFIAAGDSGAAGMILDSKTGECVAGRSRHVSELSTDPNVTAVGGVSFDPVFDASGNDTSVVATTNLRVWNDPNDGIPSGGAGGGGRSSYYAKPSYQTGLGVPADRKRDVPDVSLLASPYFPGVWTYMDSDCLYYDSCDGFGDPTAAVFGGTSLSTPAWAGIVKLIAQQNSVTRLGPLNPVLYKLANSASYSTVFADVTTGNNNFNGVTGYNAGPGFDQATGWGNVDVNELATLFFADVTSLGPARLTFSPRTLNFGKIDFADAGSGSKIRKLTIINPAKYKAMAVIDSIVGSSGFTADPSCNNATINSGRKIVCDITYTPTGLGAVSGGALTITSNAANSPGSVALKGIGIQGRLTATPVSLVFSNAVLATSTGAKTVTLKNKTDSTFTISNITNSNPAFVPSGCLGTLAANSACMITVTYVPTATTKVTDILTINDDAANSPQMVRLIGTGR
jgi:subtilase family serine protease